MRPISAKREKIEREGRSGAGRLKSAAACVVDTSFRISGLSRLLGKSTRDVQVRKVDIPCEGLPESFAGFRILHIADLHLDGDGRAAIDLQDRVRDIDRDICLLGGDYVFTRGDRGLEVLDAIRGIAAFLRGKSPVYAILGNYDEYRMGELLEACGAVVLVNDHVPLTRGCDTVYLSGLDDCSYYGSDDIELASRGIPDGAFKIMLCHSPNQYAQARRRGYGLYLAADTHGGQICFPGGRPILTGARCPRRMVRGRWSYKGMAGYTSRGVGVSRVRARLFCPPEITVITLRKNKGWETCRDAQSRVSSLD